MLRLLPALFLSLLFLTSCGTHEELKPLYQAEAVTLQDAHVEYWSDIDPIEIEPSFIRKVTRKIIGLAPIIGPLAEDLFDLPMDLVNVVFPKLPFSQRPELPADGEWNDPDVLAALKSIRIGAGYLRITPVERRGKNYEPETCIFEFPDIFKPLRCLFQGDCKCKDLGFEDFLSHMAIYLTFKDLKNANNLDKQYEQAHLLNDLGLQPESEPGFLLAVADVDNSYDRNRKILHFNVAERDLRPYMNLYDRFEIKVAAVGKYPRRKVYIDGRLRIDFVLGLQ